MNVVHLTASTLYGGPERQMLGLADHLPAGFRSHFVSFQEGGRCADFLQVAQTHGHPTYQLPSDTPHLRSATRELTTALAHWQADVLFCHGYKANIVGRIAARRLGLPVVGVSRGWTWESLKVRAYETIDRCHLRFLDHVVCVSEGQAQKVRRAGVPRRQISVIRNSARFRAFANPDPAFRVSLLAGWPEPVSRIVIAAGRLSPEKGFPVLVQAAARVVNQDPTVGFVLFGEGVERPALEAQIAQLGLGDRFRLPGFTPNLDQFLPWAQVLVQSSFTEGMPNVVLEASAAGRPVVATAVGGTPEVVVDGETGFLVAAGDPLALADRLTQVLADDTLARRLGAQGRIRMREHFSFEAQAAAYVQLMTALRSPTPLTVAGV